MAAYYNEWEAYPAQWLRNLIKAGHIAAGDVDERSITDIRADDLRGYEQCHFFAGIGGWSLALRLAGWSDERSVWTGSCPCQPFSSAGKQKGAFDQRHLWPAWFNLIRERSPTTVFGEQVTAAITKGWLDSVLHDLEGINYACAAASLPACSVGAAHERSRVWFVAHAERDESQQPWGGRISRMGRQQQPIPWDRTCERALSEFRALDDGIPRRVGATNAARNAIVPQVAAEFVSAYMECRP